MNGLNSRLDTAEEKMSHQEGRAQQYGETLKQKPEGFKEIQFSNVYLIRAPKTEHTENKGEQNLRTKLQPIS